MTPSSPAIPASPVAGRPPGRPLLRAGVLAGWAVLGVVAGVEPVLAAALAFVALLAVALARAPGLVTRAVLLVVLAVPVGWNAGTVLRTEIVVGGVTVSVSLLLPLVVTALAAVLFMLVPRAGLGGVPGEARTLFAAFAVFVGMAFGLAALAAFRGAVVPAARDLQYVVSWTWFLVPVFAWTCGRGLDTTRTLRTVVLGAAGYALILLVMYAGPDRLRHGLYATSGMASSDRISFFNGDMLVMTVPLVLILVATGGRPVLPRWVAAAAGLLMVAAVAISQTRSLMLATLLACCLAWLAVGWDRATSFRSRMVVYAVAVVAVLVVALGLLAAVGVSRARDLPSRLTERFSLLADYTQDGSFQTRSATLEAGVGRWGRSVETVVAGDGLGSLLAQYSPTGTFVGLQPAIDNAWVTLAVKGGLLLVVPLAVVLCLCEVAFVRAARRRAGGFERRLWRVVAVTFPLFIVIGTVSTSHLFKSPTEVLLVTTLGCVAVLPPVGRDGRA